MSQEVFRIDEGFGHARLSVSVAADLKDCGGGGMVMLSDIDRTAFISIDFDLWERVVKAVARAREE